jgi:hypothetical protein
MLYSLDIGRAVKYPTEVKEGRKSCIYTGLGTLFPGYKIYSRILSD